MPAKIKKYPWRVRVKRIVEDSVEVVTRTADQAEKEALQLPGVVGVLQGATIRGDRRVDDPFVGIEDGEDE